MANHFHSTFVDMLAQQQQDSNSQLVERANTKPNEHRAYKKSETEIGVRFVQEFETASQPLQVKAEIVLSINGRISAGSFSK